MGKSAGRASLPMYDFPELEEAHQAWWDGLARALRRAGCKTVPGRLTRSGDLHGLWRDGGLFWSQTCGYPLTHEFAGRLDPVATPVYRAPGCDGALYSSAVVIRRGDPALRLADLRGRACAVNGPGSHSGYNALRHLLAPLAKGTAFFSKVVTSGGHAASLEAVTSGEADLAAVDCVTFALLGRLRPSLVEPLEVLTYTASAPGLPYVTRSGGGPGTLAVLRKGLAEALEDPGLAGCREVLLIDGAVEPGERDYERIVEMEREAADLGYPEIR